MTDLEDAWNNYPTPEPPHAQIGADAQQRRHFHVAASASGTLVAAAVAAALVMTLNTGGTSGSRTTASGTAGHLKLTAFQADLKPAASCDQLLNTYRERGLKEVSAYGWDRGIMPLYGMLYESAVPQSAALSSGSALLDQTSSATGTNVQEVGVDEPDSVKANGSLLVRIDGDTLAIYDVTGDAPKRVSTIALPYFANGQILLSGTTVVAIGNDSAPVNTPTMNTRVETVSLADPAHPTITSDVAYSGALSAVRQEGTSIRLVTATGLPPLNFVKPSDNSKAALDKALEANQKLVSQSTLAQWLPTIDTGNGSQQLMPCGDVAVTPDTVPLGTTSVIGFDASNPTAASAIGLSGLTSIAYESADHLYLATDGTQLGPCACYMIPAGGATTDRTTIFAFDLVGDQAAHVATGTVEGAIKDRWSMDEVGGVLRVATTQLANGKQSSSVVMLKQSGEALTQVGRLDGLGIGETLTAARWFDTFAVVSTAQQVDPLFTVDLTDPAHPKLLGALHIPGYSSYFHPLGNGLLLGVGQNVAFNRSGEQSQAQIGLFDISNLSDVKRVAESSLAQWTRPIAGDDPHAFTWLPDHQTALTFFTTQGGTMVLGEFTVSGQSLSQKLIPVQATDPNTVRTLELPNGKVVLMAGGSVTFLPL